MDMLRVRIRATIGPRLERADVAVHDLPVIDDVPNGGMALRGVDKGVGVDALGGDVDRVNASPGVGVVIRFAGRVRPVSDRAVAGLGAVRPAGVDLGAQLS